MQIFLILLADIALMGLLFLSLFTFRMGYDLQTSFQIISRSNSFYLMVALSTLALYLFGLYELRQKKLRKFALQIFLSSALVFFVMVSVNFFFSLDRTGIFGRGLLLGYTLSFFVIMVVYRYAIQTLVSSKLENHFVFFAPETISWIEQDCKKSQKQYSWVKQLGDITKSLSASMSLVVTTSPRELDSKTEDQLIKMRIQGAEIFDLVHFYETNFFKLPVQFVDAQYFIFSDGFSLFHSPIQLRVKRAADLALSSILLLITWPIMLLAAIVIKLESKGPTLYSQLRTGLQGEVFEIYKFRSMTADAEKTGAQWAQKNDARVTRVGKLIRLTRIDELPQIVNVFKGDMSFIGPRPERPEFNENLEKLIPHYNLRHLIRPGITGWAQVMYPYGASVEDSQQKLEYDLFYIKNYSLILDLKILMRTVRIVLFGQGR